MDDHMLSLGVSDSHPTTIGRLEFQGRTVRLKK